MLHEIKLESIECDKIVEVDKTNKNLRAIRIYER